MFFSKKKIEEKIDYETERLDNILQYKIEMHVQKKINEILEFLKIMNPGFEIRSESDMWNPLSPSQANMEGYFCCGKIGSHILWAKQKTKNEENK